MQKIIFILFTVTSFLVVFQSCKKEEVTSEFNDKAFFEEYEKSNLNVFRNADTLEGASASPHGTFRLFFNDIAQAALGQDGNLPVGDEFPDGSLIVKEIFTNGSPSLLALMKKDAGSSLSAMGWVWGEYGLDGSVVYGAGKKGIGCTGCHGGDTNRDFVRSFDLH